MNIELIRANLEKGLRPIYVVLGDESLLVEDAERVISEVALRGVMAAFNHSVYRAGADGVLDCLSVARTLPMMSARRLVVLRDAQEASLQLLKELYAYCGAPSPSTVLLITGRAWPKPSEGEDWGLRTENLVKKAGEVMRFKAKDIDPIAFARETAESLGCKLGRREAELLVEMVGADLGCLRGELEKAALFVGGEGAITEEVLAEVCSMLAEAQIWDLTDAITTRDLDRALSTAHRLLEAGPRGEEHRLLAMVTWQVRQLLSLQQSLREGGGAEGVKMPSWKRQAAERALRDSPLPTAEVLERLAAANHAMHSSRAGERRVFESLLLDLTSRRKA